MNQIVPQRIAASLFAIGLSVSWAVDAAAQTPAAVEVWGAFSGVVDTPASTLVSSYAPLLVNGTAVTSSAGQALTLAGRRGAGLQGGINLFPSRHLGLQVLVDRAKVDLSGANGPYSVALQYVSAQPPDYVPRVFNTQSSTPWPDTAGSLTQWAACFNAVARTTAAGRLSASVSGGLGWYRRSGSAQSLGYTEYHMGGHSVLFSDETHVAFALEPTNSLGFNAGGDVNIALARRAAIMVGYRYLGARTIEMPVRLTAITNADQVVFSTTLEDIARQMQVAPVRLRASSSRVVIGLKITP